MIKIYLVISAALILILNNFFNILQEPYSWWLVPVLLIGFVLCFVIIQMLIFLFAILAGNTNKSADKGDRFFRFMVKISLPIIIALARVQIRTEGTEKLPENKHMMFVCNHQHDFDPVIMLSTFPHADLAFIGKKEIYVTMPLVAKIMHRLHSLPIDRENDREAAKTIIQAIKLIKDDVVSIGIFPEGYVSKSCELLPFRNGCFKIAMKANVPIAVCVINNTQSLPKRIFRKKSVVNFKLLDVIYPEQFEGMNTQQLGDIIHEKMETALKQMLEEN
ncbi:MAG: 1-acyl-sn-glycerol-3-phosphate acyltransferase [Ruminococcaceae bacterium]|nr:1-acyl-sn-glycerol-3-phosphate acyltransferase [Oscillospiraceae bacterium]